MNNKNFLNNNKSCISENWKNTHDVEIVTDSPVLYEQNEKYQTEVIGRFDLTEWTYFIRKKLQIPASVLAIAVFNVRI